MAVSGTAGGAKEIRATGFIPTGYRIVDADTASSVVVGPVTTGIENTGTLRYKTTAEMPGTAGDYEIQWDDGSDTWAATEDLIVTAGATSDNTTVINASVKFPVGTEVCMYRAYQASPSGGSPSGSPVAVATVASSGTLSVTGLTDGEGYIAAAKINGTWQQLQFTG